MFIRTIDGTVEKGTTLHDGHLLPMHIKGGAEKRFYSSLPSLQLTTATDCYEMEYLGQGRLWSDLSMIVS